MTVVRTPMYGILLHKGRKRKPYMKLYIYHFTLHVILYLVKAAGGENIYRVNRGTVLLLF
jgi:hypothetical protein